MNLDPDTLLRMQAQSKLPDRRTPHTVTADVSALCAEVSPNATPIFLKVEPADGAGENDCFPVVERQVAQHGGASVLGWQIWEMPQVLVEAEFHAVWRDPNGELHDLTPKGNVARILFLPDSARTYSKLQVNNIRRPLRDTAAARALIASMDAYFDFTNYGSRATFHGNLMSILNDEERAQLASIGFQQLQAMVAVAAELRALPLARNARKRARRERR